MNDHEVPRSIDGYLIAYVQESLEEHEICIYGNPAGLRSLGEAMIAIANLDQKCLSDQECPGDDSFHQHYMTGLGAPDYIRKGLPRLTVGRVDEKATGLHRDYFPKLEEDHE